MLGGRACEGMESGRSALLAHSALRLANSALQLANSALVVLVVPRAPPSHTIELLACERVADDTGDHREHEEHNPNDPLQRFGL